MVIPSATLPRQLVICNLYQQIHGRARHLVTLCWPFIRKTPYWIISIHISHNMLRFEKVFYLGDTWSQYWPSTGPLSQDNWLLRSNAIRFQEFGDRTSKMTKDCARTTRCSHHVVCSEWSGRESFESVVKVFHTSCSGSTGTARYELKSSQHRHNDNSNVQESEFSNRLWPHWRRVLIRSDVLIHRSCCGQIRRH